MTTEQWKSFRKATESSRCKTCRWRSTQELNGCGYALVPGHTYRIFVLEEQLGRSLKPEDLSLLLPENCEFYEEREHGRRSGIPKGHG